MNTVLGWPHGRTARSTWGPALVTGRALAGALALAMATALPVAARIYDRRVSFWEAILLASIFLLPSGAMLAAWIWERLDERIADAGARRRLKARRARS